MSAPKMNIIEALKISQQLGVAFHRPGARGWIAAKADWSYRLSLEDILADDYEPHCAEDLAKVNAAGFLPGEVKMLKPLVEQTGDNMFLVDYRFEAGK